MVTLNLFDTLRLNTPKLPNIVVTTGFEAMLIIINSSLIKTVHPNALDCIDEMTLSLAVSAK